MEEFFRKESLELARSGGAKLSIIGDRSQLPWSVRAVAATAEQITAGGSRITVNVALNYGGADGT